MIKVLVADKVGASALEIFSDNDIVAVVDTGLAPEALPVRDVVVTLGGEGCRWYQTDRGEVHHQPAYPVTPVDTTGAGDTFTGYLLAALDRGMTMPEALDLASRAGALMVTAASTSVPAATACRTLVAPIDAPIATTWSCPRSRNHRTAPSTSSASRSPSVVWPPEWPWPRRSIASTWADDDRWSARRA